MQSKIFTITIGLLLTAMISGAQVKDLDGNTYTIVKIGTQTWMAQNPSVSQFRNGVKILEARTNEEWINAAKTETPAWCYFNNDSTLGKKYGKLYNWYAIHGDFVLAPDNFVIADKASWELLTTYLGGLDTAGYHIKSSEGWSQKMNKTSGGGSNISGFTGLPAGSRSKNGRFGSLESYTNWWTSTPNATMTGGWNISVGYYDNKVSLKIAYDKDDGNGIGDGYSVRCIQK